MIALPSDIARSAPEVQAAYQVLLESMVALFEHSLVGKLAERRQDALTLAALCVGGMVLARTLPNSELAEDVRAAALADPPDRSKQSLPHAAGSRAQRDRVVTAVR